jgi:hypothetical protein
VVREVPPVATLGADVVVDVGVTGGIDGGVGDAGATRVDTFMPLTVQ